LPYAGSQPRDSRLCLSKESPGDLGIKLRCELISIAHFRNLETAFLYFDNRLSRG
jgi:hypothetical protein